MVAVAAMLLGNVPSGASLASGHGISLAKMGETAVSALAAARSSLALGQGPSVLRAASPSSSMPPAYTATGTLGTPWTALYNISQPSARATPTMAYSPSGNYVVYFGGGQNLGSAGNDTWTFAGGTWTNITASLSISPTPREDAVMSYDAADGYIVLFGGYTNYHATAGTSGNGSANLTGSYTINDTWKFQGGAWTNITSLSPAAPPALFSSSMTYDYTDGYLVLFGGSIFQGGPVGDTWTFHAGVWTNITTASGPSPPARDFASLSDDPNDGYVVLFGGYNYSSTSSVIYNDTWTFSAGVWSAVPTSLAPPPLRGAMMTYDPTTRSLLLFGGATYGYNGPFAMQSETWSYASGLWSNLTALISSAPPARDLGAFTNISSSGSLLMSDGCLGQGCASYLDLSDTWIYNASGPYGRPWVQIGGISAPSARATPALAYDPTDGYVVYFSGGWNMGTGTNDTWTFAHGVWTNITATLSLAPSQRENAIMTWDASDDYIVLFGGYTWAPGGGYSYTLNDTWKFQLGAWTNITALSSSAPPSRFSGAMTYDYTDGYVVLFGGQLLYGGELSDTWTFHAGVWTDATSTSGTPPSGR
ncbi:MAG: hypothetical protein L3J96_04015, partial [Thermoplasmata archaeon]|nr:hypothetical protein [Thermoplasmata archaeon]